CSEIDSGKAGTALILPLWFASGFHSALSSSLSREDEYGALNFVAAWSLGYRSYTIQTLGLPPLSDIVAGSTVAHDHRSASSTYAILKKIGELSEEILAKLPPVDVQKVAADLHVIPKFCEGLSVLYTPHKSSPCMCRAVEVIGEISREGVARPLSIKPVKKVIAASNDASDRTEKSFSVADRLNKVLSFIETKYNKKVPIELDSEYTRSVESLKLLISGKWEFKTRIRCDSLIGREVRNCMESNKLDLYGKWYNNQTEYGGEYQIIGRRLHRNKKIILYLSTRKNLSAQETIDERSDRWRIENLFKNVDIDSTPGNNDSEIVGYYTLAFFMAELSMAFKATTKTIGLIMNREGTIRVEHSVLKIHLKNLDRRLLNKLNDYADYINTKLSQETVIIRYKLMPR
ncbi:MAG: hypothetical protein ACYC9U_10025, partial [Nitrososphaerales archaeon]